MKCGLRTWVNSEKFPLFPYPGFRVLHKGTIFERTRRFLGRWIVKFYFSEYDEVCVLDEGIVR